MKTLTFNQLTNPSTANRDWNETTSRVLRDNPRPWPYLFRTLLVLFSLLTLSVGQMWAWYLPGTLRGEWDVTSNNMGSDNSITFYAVSGGTYQFQLTNGSNWGGNSCIQSITGGTKGTSGSNATINFSGTKDVTVTVVDETNWKVSVTISDPTYHIKYNWNTSGWSWVQLTPNGDGTYSCNGLYRANTKAFNYIKKSSDSDDGVNYNNGTSGVTLEKEPAGGDNCVFTFRPSNNSLTITRCNKVTKTNYIYFYNADDILPNPHKYFVIGHDKPTAFSKVIDGYYSTNIPHTKLAHWRNTTDTWNDATYYAFCSPSSEWANGDWGSSNLSNAGHYTAAFTNKQDLASGKYYMAIMFSGEGNGGRFSMEQQDSYTAFNKSQYATRIVLNNGATNFANSADNSVGSVSITGWYLSTPGGCSSNTAEVGSNESNHVSAAYSGEVTYTAVPGAGYTFAGWYDTKPTTLGTGTLLSTELEYTRYAPYAADYVYAAFIQETSHDVTIQEYCTSTSTEISSSTRAIGELTYATITAPEIYGYTFVRWVKSAGIELKDGDLLANTTIHVKTKTSGPYVLTATYTEDLSSPFIVTGGNKIVTSGTAWRTTADANNKMTKKTGYSSSYDAYFTVSVTAVNQGNANSNYQFKLYNTNTSTYYGLTGTGQYYLNRSESGTAKAMSTPGINVELRADALGEYEIKVNYSSTPTLTVTYPTAYTMTYSIGSVAGTSGSISAKYGTTSFSSGTKIQSGKSVTLTAPAAKDGYTWKGWYTNAAGTTGKINDTNRAITVTMNADKTLYACYTENAFNVKATATTGGTVTPTSNTSMGQVTGGNITATPSAGYSFTNWTISSGSGYFGTSGTSTTSTTANTKFRPTAATTLLGTFSEIKRTVSVTVNNAAFGSVSTTSLTNVGPATASAEVTATPVTGATFTSWTLPDGVTAAAGYTASSNPIKINATAGNKTITANFSETTYDVTLTTNPSLGTVSPSSASIGRITAVQIQATPKPGYMFKRWLQTSGSGTITSYTAAGTGQVEDAGGINKATTYITTTGNVTLQATWDEDRSSGYFVHYGNDGKNADGGTDASQTRAWSDGNLYKKAGETTGTVSYWTFTAGAADVTKVIEFKVLKGDPANLPGATWYGYNSASGGKITASITNAVLNTSYGNGRLVIVTPGDYVFKWDSNGNKLSITYPAGNYVRGDFNSWGWDHPLEPTGNANEYSATVSLTGANAEHLWSPADHGFKVVIGGVHYGKNSTIIAPNANSAAGCATNGSNIGLATTIGGNYVFTYNTSSNTVTVTYPTVTAMTGDVGLTFTGDRYGSGTNLSPYSVFVGDEVTLSKTHTSAPANDSHFKYTYYIGAKNADAATNELATRLSTAENTSYTFTVNQAIGKYPLKVGAYYEYGPDGYKVKGAARESGIVYIRVHLAPGVTLTADKVSITDGQTVTLTATPANVDLASSLIKVKYEFFNGNSTDPANLIGAAINQSNGDAVTKTVTPDCSGHANSWTYTVKMTYLGIEKTTTVTVYRKWDIYVNDVCNWGTMKLYMWDGGGAYPVAFPGTTLSKVTGSTHWYKVTLDTRYPNFKLSKQSGTESNDHVADHATYLPGTYWYLNNCKTLTEVTISTPTVTISATVTNATQINLKGTITNFGNDGSKASEMREVYFNVNGAKDAAGVAASTTNGEFTKALNNPTASASPNNTLQAAATNIAYTGTSSSLCFTNITLDKQSGTGGTSAVVAVNGVAMASGATAPTRTGYVFGGYYSEPDGAGTRYFTKTMASAHDWDQTAATATLYAKWTESVPYTVYFYNKDDWATPTAHLWVNGGESETAYPGTAMTVHQGKVYKHDYDFGEEFDRIQFNDGTDAHKTADMTIGGNLGDLVTTNQLFYNPEGDGTWTQYIMVAAWPTPTSSTKIKAVVGEKVTVEPVFVWADGLNLSDISITSSRTTGSSSVNAVIAGTKILVSGTAAGTATFSITYSYGGFTINKTLYVEIVNGITIQARIAKTDNHWVYDDIVRMHYWGTGIGNSDLTMSWIKSDATYNYYQASVPTGTDGKANFVFYYDYMNDTGTTRWRQTDNIVNVTTDMCYTISYSGNESAHSNCTTSGGLCVDSWQVQIVMGSGDIFNSNIAESSSDIVSFFAPSNANESLTYRQGVVTIEHNGETVATVPANTFSASGVYTAKINTATPALTDLALYTGDYYIRTDPSAGGWDNYLTEPTNKMTHFNRNTNFPNETFSYYWVDNIAKTSGGSGTVNIKAVVANNYNSMLTIFTPDDNITREEHGINLRFGYEPTTNDIVRGIIRGATNSDFLNLLGETDNIYKTQACAAAYVMDEAYYDAYKDSCQMQDKSNWVYDIFVFAKIDNTHTIADIYLKSNYNGIHYLLGMVKDGFGRDTNVPIAFPIIRNDTRTTNGVYRLAIIYDFKTNRLLGAWTPTDLVIDCEDDRNTDANIMFIRHENKDVAQIGFTTEGCGSTSKITGIQQAILALEIENDKNKSLGNRELHYFITMPFDCRVGDIFGIPGYMEYWGVQRYNGELRARIGWFQDTPTFWEWLDEDYVMSAGEGYLVSIDKKALQTGNVWKEGMLYQTQDTVKDGSGKPIRTHDNLADSVAWVTHTDGSLLTLYFPSTSAGFRIAPATGDEMIIEYVNQPCSITYHNRDQQDSNWKCLGTPGFRNVTLTSEDAIGAQTPAPPVWDGHVPPQFLYEFHEQTTSAVYAKGTYSVADGSHFTYHSFNSYMVQYAGTINWSQYSKGAPAVTPSPIAPRRLPSSAEKKETKMQLDLLSEENESLDRTFILLREDATKGFDQNYDLNKMVERNANQVYSLTEYDIPFAANALPLETDTVPLVVNIVNAGEYTFSMLKERHYGMTPILYDMFESQQIDLTAADYTVNLTKGKYTDRFYVLFAPVHPIATDIEITEDGTHHVLSNEAIYDVLGRRVDTVYPQHLYIVNGEKRIMR